MSDSWRPHEPQHARPPCPSWTPRVHPNPCPSSRWCHPTISSSVVLFSSCPQSLPASGSFPVSQLFASGGQSIGVSASTSVLPMNTQDWSPLGWTGWIYLQSKGLSRVFSNTQFKSINSVAAATPVPIAVINLAKTVLFNILPCKIIPFPFVFTLSILRSRDPWTWGLFLIMSVSLKFSWLNSLLSSYKYLQIHYSIYFPCGLSFF